MLDVSVKNGIMRLVKNDPSTNNGISLAMVAAMNAAFDTAANDGAIRAVVMDSGCGGFHNGAVLVSEIRECPDHLDAADFRAIVQFGQKLGGKIAALPKPVIGIARAGALGGGLELLLRSDFVFALDTANFSFPEVTLGFVAAWGGTQLGGALDDASQGAGTSASRR